MAEEVRNLAVLGTASHAGKSVMVAGLCRLLRRHGMSVAPFKSQNMALNSFVTSNGREMGRAQVVQAEAAGIEPRVDMNPILLKPSGNHRVQVVLRGQVFGTLNAQEYYARKPFFLEKVLESHARLARDFDVVVIEGAGSPVEMNLLDRDIVNLPLARELGAPCLLVADIDRGGLFASVVGTHELCSKEDRSLIQGFIINKFRGQESLFRDGVTILESRTGWPCLGVIPYVDWLHLEEEDSLGLESKTPSQLRQEKFNVCVIRLPHLSNYNDFDPLEQSNLRLVYAESPHQLKGGDLIILPGTKNTLEDLLWLRQHGFEDEIRRAVRSGAFLLGICGGFQMLGRAVNDPYGVESDRKTVPGLDFLPVETSLEREKTTRQVEGLHLETGEHVKGYEIHMGRTTLLETCRPFCRIVQRTDQTVEETDGASLGAVQGSYIHGLFENGAFASKWLEGLAASRGKHLSFHSFFQKEEMYDRWADILEGKLNLDLLAKLIGRPLGSRAAGKAVS